MKKKVLALFLAAAMILGVAGCGGGGQSGAGSEGASSDSGTDGAADTEQNAAAEDTEPDAGSDGEQIVLKYTGWGSPAEKKTTQNVISNFEKNHPNVKVEYVHIPTDYNTKLTTMIAAGQGPDVALLNGDTALQWATEGQLMNMLELAEDDPEFDLDAIMPQVVYWWDEGKACGVNGALEVYGLMYNRDILAQAGIEVPTTEGGAWTWDEFVEVLRTLTIDQSGRNALDPDFDAKNIKQFGIYIPSGGNMLAYAMAYTGQDFLSEDGNSINLVGTEAEAAVQKFADLINVYHVAPNPAQSKNLPGGSTALASKKVAMIWDGQWSLMDMVANKVNFGVGIPPKMYDKPMTIALGEPVVVFSSTKHPKEAYELQKAFQNPEYTMELIEGGLWMPVLKDWYEDEELVGRWATGNDAHPEGYVDAILNNAFNNCVPSLTYSIKNLPKIMDVLNPALDKVWLGESTAAEAFASVEEKANAQAQGKYPRP